MKPGGVGAQLGDVTVGDSLIAVNDVNTTEMAPDMAVSRPPTS